MSELIEAFNYHFTYYAYGGSSISFLYFISPNTVIKYFNSLFRITIFLALIGISLSLLFGHLTSLYLIFPLIALFIIKKMENNFKLKNGELPKDVSFWYLKNEKKQPKHINFRQKIGILLLPIPMLLFILLLILELYNAN